MEERSIGMFLKEGSAVLRGFSIVCRLTKLELICNYSVEAELTALGEYPTLTYVSSIFRFKYLLLSVLFLEFHPVIQTRVCCH